MSRASKSLRVTRITGHGVEVIEPEPPGRPPNFHVRAPDDGWTHGPRAMSAREANEQVAAEYVEQAASNGVTVPREQALDRVRSARARSDREAANGNR